MSSSLALSGVERRLDRPAAARAHVVKASEAAATPLERHRRAFEAGLMFDASADPDKAREQFRRCAESGIETFLAREARPRLKAL